MKGGDAKNQRLPAQEVGGLYKTRHQQSKKVL
jgi:hypothetical protein